MDKRVMNLTMGNLISNIADVKEQMRNGDSIIFGGEIITNEERLNKKLENKIMTDIFTEADRIIAERREERLVKEASISVKKDFERLMQEVKRASEADPEDQFLKDILNCMKGGEI